MDDNWRDIESAPTNKVILLFGKLIVLDRLKPLYGDIERPVRATGYWDPVDDAWSIVGGTWKGPWIAATHWQHIPEGPTT